MAADEEGNGEVDLRFKSLLTVSQRRLGLSLSDDEKSKLEKYCFFGIKTEMTVTFSEIFKFRPVESRMSAFIDRFSMTKSISKKKHEEYEKTRIRLGLRIGDFSDERSLSCNFISGIFSQPDLFSRLTETQLTSQKKDIIRLTPFLYTFFINSTTKRCLDGYTALIVTVVIRVLNEKFCLSSVLETYSFR